MKVNFIWIIQFTDLIDTVLVILFVMVLFYMGMFVVGD